MQPNQLIEKQRSYQSKYTELNGYYGECIGDTHRKCVNVIKLMNELIILKKEIMSRNEINSSSVLKKMKLTYIFANTDDIGAFGEFYKFENEPNNEIDKKIKDIINTVYPISKINGSEYYRYFVEQEITLINPTTFIRIIKTYTNANCKSLFEKELNNIILDNFKYYGLILPHEFFTIALVNNKTNLELFFNYYFPILEIIEIKTIDTQIMIELFLICFAHAIHINCFNGLDKSKYSTNIVFKNSHYECELFDKLLEQYIIKNTKCSTVFFTELVIHEYTQNLINIYENNKIIPPYNFLVASLAYNKLELSKKICTIGAKLSENILNDVFTITIGNLKSENLKITDFYNSIDFLIENNFKKVSKSNIMKYFEYKNNNSELTRKFNSKIASLLFTKKDDITFNEFIFLTKKNIVFENVHIFKFNLVDTKLCEIYDELNINPYNVNYKSSMQTLLKLCYECTPISKIKKICKTVKPDIECLRKACIDPRNYHTVKYLIESHYLKIDEVCLWNIINNCKSTPMIRIIRQFFRPQDLNQANQENNNKKLAEDISDSESDEDFENEESEKKQDIELKVKPIVKPIVKAIVKPIVEPIVELKVEPIVELKVEPIVELKVEPKKPVKKLVKKITEAKVEAKVEAKPVARADDKDSNTIKQTIVYREEINEDGKLVKKKIIKKIIKKNSCKEDSVKDDSVKMNNEKDNIIVKVELIEKVNIPSEYDYRIKRKVKKSINTLLNKQKCEEVESHIELRKQVLEYIQSNKLIEKNKIKIKTFDLNKEDEIDFSNIDKFVYKLFE
jgi:hypothetical protein